MSLIEYRIYENIESWDDKKNWFSVAHPSNNRDVFNEIILPVSKINEGLCSGTTDH